MAIASIDKLGGVTSPKGFKAAGVHCGLKRKRVDLALLYSEKPATCAGTFTTNLVKAAPLRWTQKVIAGGTAQVAVVNSGNANACNGPQGDADAAQMAALAAEACGVSAQQVVVGSTGVIGMPLDMSKVAAGIAQAAPALSYDGGDQAALAITTTDTLPKHLSVDVQLAGGVIRIGGMAKGSGMIHPNMATMMCFITSDAAIDAKTLQQAVSAAVNISFNMVSVDGDTSTNDMLVAMANGMSGVTVASASDQAAFQEGLNYVAVELAKMVARDGEGASKLIEIQVKGARSLADARLVARSISTSNLVKTAIYGEDANWGRIFCAAGYSGAQFVPEQVDIYMGDLQVAKSGMALPFDEGKAKSILQENEILILLDLHDGDADATAWTCDFTYDYVKINASYRS